MTILSRLVRPATLAVAAVCTTWALSACSSHKPPPPAPLQANPASAAAHTLWTHRLPADVGFPLQAAVLDNQWVLADNKGTVQALHPDTGAVLWSAALGQRISAGVGSDGTTAAVVTASNTLVALRGGAVAWQTPLSASTSTAPFVGGGRIFVFTNDRQVAAFDATNGYKLWQVRVRGGDDTLALSQSALFTSLQGALLVGTLHRTFALHPDTGAPLGQAQFATARGSDEIQRTGLVLAPASREGASLCARTFGAAVSCLDYAKGSVLWRVDHAGSYGIGGNTRMVVGADNSSVLTAWQRTNGQTLWTNTSLRNRQLGAPLVVGDTVVVGDAYGTVHILSASTGALRNRITVDGSAQTVAPAAASGQRVLVVTQKGQVTALHVQ